MICVITGDVINSTKNVPRVWLKPLKKELNEIGESPKVWEIYRGDSFQVLVNDPVNALITAIKIKAALKSIQNTDVRMALGLGSRTYNAPKITESNGSAFVHSGEKFELLKSEKQTLCIKSDWPDFDREMNLYLKLILIPMDSWTVNAAEVVKAAIDYPGKSQEELGLMVGVKQNAVSSRLKRACYSEVMEVNEMYKTKLKTLK
ncbi:MAG: hypothetical protein ABI237_08465 [Ginsengibacter sp.]